MPCSRTYSIAVLAASSLTRSDMAQVFDAWYLDLWGLETVEEGDGALREAPPKQLVQQCDFSATECNPKCPLYT